MHRPLISKLQNIKPNSLSSKNLHQTFLIYTQINEDVQLYPQSPAKNRLRSS
ncbi:hypothetical protein Hanom_Chr14g01287731 [Helianthus anomalus]|uniref:Uncharacterized protein n=1 Tax=Helianthus annuus TaxID=4232 RepID=A0A251T2X6_HELAN